MLLPINLTFKPLVNCTPLCDVNDFLPIISVVILRVVLPCITSNLISSAGSYQ